MRVLKCRSQALVDELTPGQMKALTLWNKYQSKYYSAFKKTPHGFLVPRAWAGALPEERDWPEEEIPFRGELREDQETLLRRAFQTFGKHPGAILAAPTGKGKTVMGLYVAHKLGLRTVIVVPSRTLFTQWVRAIHKWTRVEPGIIVQDRCILDRPIVVAMLKTLSMGERLDKRALYTAFGLSIWDECHEAATEHFHRAVKLFWDKKRLGLSATPERKDGMHPLFNWHVGPTIRPQGPEIVLPMIPKVVVVPTKAKPTVRHRPDGNLNLGALYNSLAKDKERNKLIVDLAEKAARKGRRVLILVDRRAHAVSLARELQGRGVSASVAIGNSVDTTGQVIVATYGVAGRGFDLPELDTLIMASPRADVAQAVGRVVRTAPGKKNPVVIDLLDGSSVVLRNWFKSRQKFYSKIGAEMKWL